MSLESSCSDRGCLEAISQMLNPYVAILLTVGDPRSSRLGKVLYIVAQLMTLEPSGKSVPFASNIVGRHSKMTSHLSPSPFLRLQAGHS